MDTILDGILSIKLASKFGNLGFNRLPPHLKSPNLKVCRNWVSEMTPSLLLGQNPQIFLFFFKAFLINLSHAARTVNLSMDVLLLVCTAKYLNKYHV